MGHRAILFAFAAAAVGVANVSAPALARGGGGGGGGHGGFAAGRSFMGFGAHARSFRTPGNSFTQRGGRAVVVSRSNPSRRVLSPIRPEVITVTPWGYLSAFDSGFVGGAPTNVFIGGAPASAPGSSDPPQTQAASPAGGPQAGPADTKPADPNSPLVACHPVPSGYYCKWPS